MTYIHQQDEWPKFTWSADALNELLTRARFHQGLLLGKAYHLGLDQRAQASLGTLAETVVKSSKIEGEHLDMDAVRSSIARRLGIPMDGMVPVGRDVEGIVEVMIDATSNADDPLTEDRMFGWHAALFPTGRSGMSKITVGQWRDDALGPMQIVSGPIGHERVHFEAPPANEVPGEMAAFLQWLSVDSVRIHPYIRAGIAHLWFVTIHPFDDGNGRIARAIGDLVLKLGDYSTDAYYSMSSQIEAERQVYYDVLGRTTKGGLDITPWLVWFVECLDRSYQRADRALDKVIAKAQFWQATRHVAINDRQRKVILLLQEAFEGKLTSSKWAKLTKVSQDTAGRDITDLVEKGLLAPGPTGGRGTTYHLVVP